MIIVLCVESESGWKLAVAITKHFLFMLIFILTVANVEPNDFVVSIKRIS